MHVPTGIFGALYEISHSSAAAMVTSHSSYEITLSLWRPEARLHHTPSRAGRAEILWPGFTGHLHLGTPDLALTPQ